MTVPELAVIVVVAFLPLIAIVTEVTFSLSEISVSTEDLSCCTLCISVDCLDFSTYLINCGASTPTSTAMMAITTISSTREKPLLSFFSFFAFMF